MLSKHRQQYKNFALIKKSKIGKFCSKSGSIWSKNKETRSPIWPEVQCLLDRFQYYVLSMRFDTQPYLVVEKKSKKYRKYCIAMDSRTKMPRQNEWISEWNSQKTPTDFFDSTCISEMMNFWVKTKPKHRFQEWIRQQFSWSRPVKGEEGRRDVSFNTWDVREERREGSRWWTWVSLYISLSLCEIVGMLLISEHRTVHVNS